MAVPFTMTTIVWASDLHLDHASDAVRNEFAVALRDSRGDVVVASGDTSVSSRLVSDLQFVQTVAGRPLHFVLGNHDHYGATVGKVRDAVIELAARNPDVHWLPPEGVVQLDETAALVGVDGWADGRLGNALTTPIRLNDDRLIGELAAQPTRSARLAVKRALADADAARLATLLDLAVLRARRVVVVTHVPPFIEALPHSGRLATADWLPLLVSDAIGNLLRRTAGEHTAHHFLVLAGHTHAAADVMVLPNLRCRIAGARYGEPAVESVSVS
ncbi:MAG: metallophosphoesterase [Gemmatimonadales bacterium]